MLETKKKIAVIPANPKYDKHIRAEHKKLRVAAYCRVSTELEQQESSYETQVSYYTEKIKSNPNWHMAGVYADDGKSGTNTKKRDDFKTMIEECENGKIDMVITKSVSRFARNTVDSLITIRKLKEKNIAVLFEKENINTLDATGELLITILSSQAQEESRNISENTRWGVVRKFENGKLIINHNKFLGYTKSKDGELIILPEEAELVRMIFRMYLEGKSSGKIKKYLEEKQIKTVTGNEKWHATVIEKMLSNEKYMGDALLQKTYTVDFLTKKRVLNNGIVPQYYVEDDHEPIIPKELFYKVQEEKLRRKSLYKSSSQKNQKEKSKFSSKYALTGILICGECGQEYRRVTWAKNGKKSFVWRCYSRLTNGTKKCKYSETLPEEALNRAIMTAINKIVDDKEEFVGAFRQNVIRVMGSYKQDRKPCEYDEKIKQKQDEMMQIIEENAKKGSYSEEFDEEYKRISGEIEELKMQKLEMYRQKKMADSYQQRVIELDEYIKETACKVTEYDDDLVRRLIQRIKVESKEKIVIQFRSGIIMEQVIEYE